MTAHENFPMVLVQRALGITNSRHVLDNHSVVRALALLVEDGISLDHIVDDIALADFLAPEGLLLAQVLPICVTS